MKNDEDESSDEELQLSCQWLHVKLTAVNTPTH